MKDTVSISISGLDLLQHDIKRAMRREALLANNHFALGFALKRLGGSIEIPIVELGEYSADDFEIVTTVRTKEDTSQVVLVELRKR